MKKKITQEEWFAAASANDLWGASYINPMLFVGFAGQNVNESCEARHEDYSFLLDKAENFLELSGDYPADYLPDRSFLAAQIGCEKAGL